MISGSGSILAEVHGFIQINVKTKLLCKFIGWSSFERMVQEFWTLFITPFLAGKILK